MRSNKASIDPTAEIGEGTKIYGFVWIGPNVKIGKNCRIQTGVYIPENVIIGDDVFIGPHAVFLNDKYPPSHGGWKKEPPTIIENKVSIGGNVTILPNLKISHGAMIGAGSVVTKNIGVNRLAYGNPARIVGWK